MGAAALVLQVVRVFPRAEAKHWLVPNPMPAMIGLSWLPELTTASFPAASTLSQAQPLPNRVSAALVEASLKASMPRSSADGSRQVACRRVAPMG